jgi:hypothetical protein
MNNPFVTNGYAGPDYFCDRAEETNTIRELLLNENNIALISPRRLGKTDLIYHVFDNDVLRKNYHCFVVDVYATKNLSDFVNLLGKAVVEALRPKGKAVWSRFVNLLSSLRSEISFDINGLPVWGMGLGEISNPTVTLEEIFTYLNQADKPCLVAIDEFQQITKYNDKTVEATLRTYVQRCTSAHFIFSGSQRHLMNGMFTSPSRPFYQSVTIINLQPLQLPVYTTFAENKFKEAKKDLDPAVVAELYTRFDAVTSYMHRVLNVLFAKTQPEEKCTIDMVDQAIEYILRMSSDTYEALLYQMPEKQRAVFIAIASEGKAKEVTSGAFLKKNKLPSASSVSSAIKGLLDKDFITMDKGTYMAYDQFFVLWMKSKGLLTS